MRSLQAHVVASLAALLITSTAAAQVTVGPVGSGAQFNEIQDAIDVSPAGTTIFVAPGNYTRELSIDKAIVIVGRGDTTSRPVLAIPLAAQQAGVVHVSVRDLSAGERVLVTGVDFTIPTDPFSGFVNPDWVNGNSKVLIENCDGRVILSNCRLFNGGIRSASVGIPLPSIVQVANARSVLLDECTFQYVVQHSAPLFDSATMAVVDSAVTLSNCEIRGAILLASSATHGGRAPSALSSVDSTIRVSGSRLVGGQGREICSIPGGLDVCFDLLRTHPSMALAASSSVIDISGGLSNLNAGGSGVCNYSGYSCPKHSGIVLSGGCTLWTSVDVVIVPSPGTPVKPPITSTPTDVIVSRPHRAPVLELDPSYANPGTSTVLELFGNASTVNFTFYALDIANPYFPDGFEGSIIISPALAVFLNTVGTDGAGNGALNINVPPFAPLAGLAVHFQCVEVSGLGALLSNAATLTIEN